MDSSFRTDIGIISSLRHSIEFNIMGIYLKIVLIIKAKYKIVVEPYYVDGSTPLST
ncbi:MAG TPA: hypothetical protein VF222_10765 [Nitrososphaeraceae archaeon]